MTIPSLMRFIDHGSGGAPDILKPAQTGVPAPAAGEYYVHDLLGLPVLDTVITLAPLLGLLGTVTGMIASFQVIEGLKAPTPKDLASGVYESLVNTTMGLFIGIVWLTAFFFYKNLVTKIALEINLQAARIISPFASAEGGGRHH